MKSKRKNKIAALILAAAAIASIVVILNTTPAAAKYVSRLTSGDSARVATWGFTVTDFAPESDPMISGSETAACYSFDVISKAEVAATYAITITGVPAGMSAKLDDSEWVAGTGGEINFVSDAMAVGPGGSSAHRLYLKADDTVESRNYSIGAYVTVTQVTE